MNEAIGSLSLLLFSIVSWLMWAAVTILPRNTEPSAMCALHNTLHYFFNMNIYKWVLSEFALINAKLTWN